MLNEYAIYWAGIHDNRVVVITRPSGTTGNIQTDFEMECLQLSYSAGTDTEIIVLGTLSALPMYSLDAHINKNLYNAQYVPIKYLPEHYPTLDRDLLIHRLQR